MKMQGQHTETNIDSILDEYNEMASYLIRVKTAMRSEEPFVTVIDGVAFAGRIVVIDRYIKEMHAWIAHVYSMFPAKWLLGRWIRFHTRSNRDRVYRNNLEQYAILKALLDDPRKFEALDCKLWRKQLSPFIYVYKSHAEAAKQAKFLRTHLHTMQTYKNPDIFAEKGLTN